MGHWTVGITKGETLRLSFVNVGTVRTVVFCGLWQNPPLIQDSHILEPGNSDICDLRGADLPHELFDRTGRVQVRAFIKSSDRAIRANLEIFDSGSGRTSLVLPLQEFSGIG